MKDTSPARQDWRCLQVVLFAALLPLAAEGEPDRSVQEYWLQLAADGPLRAHVRARISVRNKRLFTGEGGADQFPRHWAELVRDLEVRDARGTALEVTEVTEKDSPRGGWRLSNGTNGAVTMSYNVDLGFARRHWAPTNEKAGYFDGKALYLVTKMLFVASELDSPVRLHVEVPPGTKVATPWNRSAGEGLTFDVPNAVDLQQNTLVVGDFPSYEVQQGNFHMVLALLGKLRGSGRVAATTLAGFAQSYGKLFPTTPPSSYLITIFDSDQDNGESFERSSAFVTKAPLASKDIILWGNTEGHELFHFWCGQQIAGAQREQSEWFEEGFTEYYANLTLIRRRMVSEAVFLKKMENMLGKYLYFRSVPQFANVSILDSGTRKTTYRFGVYNGGWTVAFGLDMTIRQATGGKRTLDDFMRSMYEQFGLTHKRFSYQELVATASEVAGKDLAGFFHRYVDGKEVMPVLGWLNDLGYHALVQDYAAELYLLPMQPTSLRRVWLGQDR